MLCVLGMADRSDEWVEVWQALGQCYYWNRRTQQVCSDPVAALWACQKDPSSGQFYYWRVGSSEQPVWHLPELVPQAEPGAEPAPQEATGGECQNAHWSEPGIPDYCKADDSWIKVESASESSYFWNFKLGVAGSLPQGKLSEWTALRSQDGSWYYVHVHSGATSWEIPCRKLCAAIPPSDEIASLLNERWFEVHAPVCITGLTRQPRFNTQVGVVIDISNARCFVQLPEESSSVVLALLPGNIKPLPVGSLVELYGLSNHAFNGMVGTIQASLVGVQAEVMRYIVRLADGSEKSLKGTNLKPRSRLWDVGAAISRELRSRRQVALQWRDEHPCIFVDSKGSHRRFSLHLPIGFNPGGVSPDGQIVSACPLLIYMHGTGGGTFFTHSKKSLGTVGMRYAAKNFVVVSPRCEWTWRESPREWVIELIEAFRALDWLSHSRMYLTGCSMGGMSAWELGAARPDLFAAIAPVAAHHKQDKTSWIAQRLSATPLYIVHDTSDGTCPMAPEQRLWQLIQSSGNAYFKKKLTTGVDHCKLHEHAYCLTEDLYHWFLQYG